MAYTKRNLIGVSLLGAGILNMVSEYDNIYLIENELPLISVLFVGLEEMVTLVDSFEANFGEHSSIRIF